MPRLPGRREAVTRGPSCRHRLRFQGAEQPTTRWRSAPTARSPLPRRGAAVWNAIASARAYVSASKARSSPHRGPGADGLGSLRFQGAEQPRRRSSRSSPRRSPLPRRGAAKLSVIPLGPVPVSASKARSSPVKSAAAAAVRRLRFQGAEQPLRQSDSVAVHHGHVFGFQGTGKPLRQPSLRACRRIQGTEQPLRSTNQWPRLPGRRAALASRRDRAGRPARYRRDFQGVAQPLH
jgi:hypothetical protein